MTSKVGPNKETVVLIPCASVTVHFLSSIGRSLKTSSMLPELGSFAFKRPTRTAPGVWLTEVTITSSPKKLIESDDDKDTETSSALDSLGLKPKLVH